MILATGGLGHLYSATTNPEGSTGDGIALALWAGVAVSDIEFVQFHPTMLFDGSAGRGPGKRARWSPRRSAARARFSSTAAANRSRRACTRWAIWRPATWWPRAIDARLRATGEPCVFLDARGIADFKRRFPTVTAACRAAGVDPVDPADPGGAGRALQLRRRRHRRARSDRTARAVRRR